MNYILLLDIINKLNEKLKHNTQVKFDKTSAKWIEMAINNKNYYPGCVKILEGSGQFQYIQITSNDGTLVLLLGVLIENDEAFLDTIYYDDGYGHYIFDFFGFDTEFDEATYNMKFYDTEAVETVLGSKLKELDERYPDSKLDANMKDSKRTLKEEILNTPLNEEDFKAHAILPDIEKKDVVVQKDHSFVIDAQSAAQAHANTKGR